LNFFCLARLGSLLLEGPIDQWLDVMLFVLWNEYASDLAGAALLVVVGIVAEEAKGNERLIESFVLD
jgi:hypothetical protein